jgi:hypothetical protein
MRYKIYTPLGGSRPSETRTTGPTFEILGKVRLITSYVYPNGTKITFYTRPWTTGRARIKSLIRIRAFHLERRDETEGASKSEDIEINPQADSHTGTNQA